MNTETVARERIARAPELASHAETLLYDWPNHDEHMIWLTTAPVAELVEWAEYVEEEIE